jgi:hypothetical protein
LDFSSFSAFFVAGRRSVGGLSSVIVEGGVERRQIALFDLLASRSRLSPR